MRKKLLLWVCVVMIGVGTVGCITEKVTDPNTGIVTKVTKLDSNNVIVKNAESGLTVGQMIAAASGTIWPVGTLIAGIFGGLLTAWKKYKPLLVTAQSQATQSYNVTASLVEAIEQFKETNPTEWTALKAKLTEAIGPNAENVIRALRGLPPIE